MTQQEKRKKDSQYMKLWRRRHRGYNTRYMRDWRKGMRRGLVTILGVRVRWRTL